MRIALFGAGGTIGSRILREAARRGHEVTALGRSLPSVEGVPGKVAAMAADVLDPAQVARAAAGHDALVSAFGVGQGDPRVLLQATQALIEGAERAGVKRLLAVGGAGSLEVEPGVPFVETPRFGEPWKPIGRAHLEALHLYRRSDAPWTVLTPPGMIQPGERTGRYRVGGDRLLADEQGRSAISAEDFAVALVDELEQGRFVRRRFTVAY